MFALAGYDAQASVADAILVARSARGANLGWRAICVRAQRTLGRELVAPLSELDLDAELPSLTLAVQGVTLSAPPDLDALVFEIGAGLRIAGLHGFDPGVRWLGPPSWRPAKAELPSSSLDALARFATELRGDRHDAVMRFLRFGAAALLGRFAARDLPYRVAVAFESGDFAEVTASRPDPTPTPTPPLLTRL